MSELSEIYDLEKEIRIISGTLNDVRTRAAMRGGSLTIRDTRVGGNSDAMADYIARTEELQGRLLRLKAKAQEEKARLTAFVETVPDSLTRQTMILRFVRGYSWELAALEIGGGNTAQGVRMRVYRCLKAAAEKDAESIGKKPRQSRSKVGKCPPFPSRRSSRPLPQARNDGQASARAVFE